MSTAVRTGRTVYTKVPARSFRTLVGARRGARCEGARDSATTTRRHRECALCTCLCHPTPHAPPRTLFITNMVPECRNPSASHAVIYCVGGASAGPGKFRGSPHVVKHAPKKKNTKPREGAWRASVQCTRMYVANTWDEGSRQTRGQPRPSPVPRGRRLVPWIKCEAVTTNSLAGLPDPHDEDELRGARRPDDQGAAPRRRHVGRRGHSGDDARGRDPRARARLRGGRQGAARGQGISRGQRGSREELSRGAASPAVPAHAPLGRIPQGCRARYRSRACQEGESSIAQPKPPVVGTSD